MDNIIWIVELYDGSKWTKSYLCTTRRSARSFKKKILTKTRIRKYVCCS